MNWKYKAAIQNLIAALPPGSGNPVYYWLQSRYGGLRHPTPVSRFKAGAEIIRRICHSGRTVESSSFLEVGTGHQLNLPLSLWLCGASQVTTVDLNPYLKESLVMNDLKYLRSHEQQTRELFADLPVTRSFEERLQHLTASQSFRQLLETTSIRYLAPADATRLELKAQSIDYHVSFTVLEHIPSATLRGIFLEGLRLLKPRGLFVHFIDFTDHFAHSDQTISSVNFLQFSERQWQRLAGNRFMFHNRLRVDEFRALLRELPLEILALDAKIDQSATDALKKGLPLSERFRAKDLTINATMDAWLVASP